jgi:SRSO17 transposase
MEVSVLKGLGSLLLRFLGQFDDCFYSKKGRQSFRTYVQGQLGHLERKSMEPMADAAGVPPRTLQEFLSHVVWNEDAARDRVQSIVRHNHSEGETVAVVDETAFPKKGTETACVQRQYCGATGKVDNCVLSVNLAFACEDFHTLIDSRLYLPKSWHEDRARCRKVGIPDDVVYRPLHRIALEEIDTARDNDVRLDWITSDERYGEVPEFLEALEDWGLFYVIEVPKTVTGWTARPPVWNAPSEVRGKVSRRPRSFPCLSARARAPQTVEKIADYGRLMRAQAWTAFNVKETLKGPEVWQVRVCRFYQHRDGLPSRELRLIVAVQPLLGTTKYFLAHGPEGTTLQTFVRVAFTRWRVERCFEDSKGELGMDHFEARRYLSIKRHLVVTMVSHLFLAEQTQRLRGKKRRRPLSHRVSAPESN